MEQWRCVPGFEGAYSISSYGRLRRNVTRCGNPSVRVLRTPIDKDGYTRAVLCFRGKRHDFLVHRLVALAFVGGPPYAGATVNHIDGDKSNNSPSNLEYMTAGDNLRHSHRVLGKSRAGERNGRSKLTADDIASIRLFYVRRVVTQAELARTYGVNQPTISAIISGRLWPLRHFS